MADPPQMQQTQQVNEPPPPDLLKNANGGHVPEKSANQAPTKHKVCILLYLNYSLMVFVVLITIRTVTLSVMYLQNTKKL